MKIKVSTQVQQGYKEVWSGFNRELFQRLSPPFPFIKLLRFDGCEKGDVVQLELNFILFRQRWDALIIENQSAPSEIYFIDKGTAMPFFLKSWEHKHIIRNLTTGSEITDDIKFESYHPILSICLYPVLYLQFIYRKPIYKKIFTRNQGN